jgi:hypothetical protein
MFENNAISSIVWFNIQIESGGTVLSTNWEEVKKGKVKGSPPQGMEMHDWNEDHRL